MVKIAGEIRPGHQWAAQEWFFETVQPAVIDPVLPPAGERVFTDVTPARLGYLGLTNDLNLPGITDTYAFLVGDADEWQS